MRDIVFGDAGPSERIGGLQTPGGTAAVRVLAGLVARATPAATVWVPDPTWFNHPAILADAGLRTRSYPYYDRKGANVRFAAMQEALDTAAPGDVVLLHGCCHNPTGSDLSIEQWEALGDLFLRRELIPFVDLAYQGFGRGLDEDAGGLRQLAVRLPEMLVATSCSKNFGLYSERTGCAFVLAPTASKSEVASAQMAVCARVLYSMPPDHGSAIVRTICEDSALCTNWKNELGAIRTSMAEKRVLLADALRDATGTNDYDYLERQRGMFSLLDLPPEGVEAARTHHGIYMVHDGRINVAGLPIVRIPDLVSTVLALQEIAQCGAP
jgi:aromatic-amino-acid transaminase